MTQIYLTEATFAEMALKFQSVCPHTIIKILVKRIEYWLLLKQVLYIMIS